MKYQSFTLFPSAKHSDPANLEHEWVVEACVMGKTSVCLSRSGTLAMPRNTQACPNQMFVSELMLQASQMDNLALCSTAQLDRVHAAWPC